MQTPNYMNPYQQYQYGYQPTNYMSNYQPPQQHNVNLGGKMVDSIDAVRATDIPMDGSRYYFPKADGSEIYSKSWLANGTTQILTYKPVLEGNTTNSPAESEKSEIERINALTEDIMERFNNIDDRFDKLEKAIKGRSTRSRSQEKGE